MTDEIINMFETMASYGTAPEEGCSLFGVGYEETFNRLKNTYLVNRFKRGASAEKFIVGPFGSGKTHFLHQFLEIARTVNCATSKVTLNKDIDFTQSLTVYKEIVLQLRLPNGQGHGMVALLQGCVEGVRAKAPSPEVAAILIDSWIKGLVQTDFKLPAYGRVLQHACIALLDKDLNRFDSACRWLGGEVEERKLCEMFDVQPIQKSEHNRFAKRALHSLFQFIKHAGYQGTVVGFDEAEQGFAVDKKKTARILSALMADINAIVELEKGAVLLLYAVTPDLIETMDSFAALQQRIADPGFGNGFFDGNVYAPVIDLTKRPEMVQDLTSIGHKLVELMYSQLSNEMQTSKENMLDKVSGLAVRVTEEDLSSSNRRTMVKYTCTMLLQDLDSAYQETATGWSEDEV